MMLRQRGRYRKTWTEVVDKDIDDLHIKQIMIHSQLMPINKAKWWSTLSSQGRW